MNAVEIENIVRLSVRHTGGSVKNAWS